MQDAIGFHEDQEEERGGSGTEWAAPALPSRALGAAEYAGREGSPPSTPAPPPRRGESAGGGRSRSGSDPSFDSARSSAEDSQEESDSEGPVWRWDGPQAGGPPSQDGAAAGGSADDRRDGTPEEAGGGSEWLSADSDST